MDKKLQANIWKYAVLLIANKRIFVAIWGAYYLTIPDVTVASVGIILLAGNLAGFIFEIPSGYISDKIGHKQALVVSRVFTLLSTALFLVANSMAVLVIAAIALSLGFAFHSGTGSAFMHETLKGLGREKEYASVMGKVSSVGFAVPIVLMVTVPFLVGISFRLPFAVALVIDVIGLLAALALTVPPVPKEEIKEIGVTNFRQVMREGYNLNFFSPALFIGIVSGFLFTVGGFRAPYQMFLEIPVIWFGIFFGVGRVFASLMLAYTGKIRAATTIYSFFRFKLIFYTALILVLGFISTWWVVVLTFIVINAFQWGLSKLSNSYLMEIISTSKFKATLLSISAQIQEITAGVVSFALGFTIERLSYQHGFLYLGIAFFVILLPLYLYIERRHVQSTQSAGAAAS